MQILAPVQRSAVQVEREILELIMAAAAAAAQVLAIMYSEMDKMHPRGVCHFSAVMVEEIIQGQELGWQRVIPEALAGEGEGEGHRLFLAFLMVAQVDLVAEAEEKHYLPWEFQVPLEVQVDLVAVRVAHPLPLATAEMELEEYVSYTQIQR